ncbi:glutamate formimidoyltransferase [Saprospira sp. CCB-QB6]|uniref:glutamate formimidoyltransferase n=1 Tax=Saprospira sp. CCB-QB6 TaxID=3023936 RepID=UPI00234AB79C|nr:glutamate formimidoyltransferase [Saprospira sp. CCB-QB6]WCL81248.1 glutamate formimidoyltransferase [Saprospira sp. CCB-QB6]
MSKRLIECVPNFSEGRRPEVIAEITAAIAAVEGVKLLNVDPGKATNRTVVTFVGEPEAVIEGAFQGIKKASELIDMSKHKGEHPRMGATDVCPLIPISGVSVEEAVAYSQKLGERVGQELNIPVFLYEHSASQAKWKNLANIRSGEYEAMADKLATPEFTPDYGPKALHKEAGVMAIGARDFLIAYNINLNTTSVRRANSVAFDIREGGRVKREGDPITGKKVLDENGQPVRIPGACKGVKGIGWFIEEYGVAQVSMNITNIAQSPLHIVFEESCKSATKRGMRVTGSELVGLVPLKVMLDAGRYFLRQQQRSVGVSEQELIKIAVKTMGLDELSPFDPNERIIEYQLKDASQQPLIQMSLSDFAAETSSESPAPGGGSISAYVGALGAALGGMVANLSSHKRGWDDRWEYFSDWAERAQVLERELVDLVDKDTDAFNGIMAAFRLPKGSEAEKAARKEAIAEATRQAILVPFQVMKACIATLPLLEEMAKEGNPNSISDVGVGMLCARAALRGAYLNVKINSKGMENDSIVSDCLQEGALMIDKMQAAETAVLAIVETKL